MPQEHYSYMSKLKHKKKFNIGSLFKQNPKYLPFFPFIQKRQHEDRKKCYEQPKDTSKLSMLYSRSRSEVIVNASAFFKKHPKRVVRKET